ncbi:MAG TPA: putative 4-mercaptohistidine N1-methyltransferase [Verrucomicrobiae bacterium]
MSSPYYESDRAVSEYLLFHYGTAEETLPYPSGPRDALFYPVRCVVNCLDTGSLPPDARALDIGCSVGRSSFELARHCTEVIGIDYSKRFVDVATRLRDQGGINYVYVEEGDITRSAVAVVPTTIDRRRVRFEQGDAQELREDLGQFEVVFAANLIDRLREPLAFVRQLPDLVKPGGQLILTSPYTWLEEYTPREKWLGGTARDGRARRTVDTLKGELANSFELKRTLDLPFLIREHVRKYQWSVAQASVWRRK